MKRFKYLTLAALVGIWACDSGTSTTTEPTPTGTISGTVTIEGTGASGVTVTLSSGTSTTTGADGTYAFSNVNAGAYTVAISGYASDATFDATTKAATITSAGQVATVNFAGSYIKTSSIVGVVSAGGGALPNVVVTLSGASSASATTDAAGAYSFSGLRAGSYTVTISGYGSEYTFPATSQTATLGVGESKVVSFSGAYVTTASVSGRMFLDENAKDGVYTAGLEDNLSVANVTVTLELSVGNDITTQTAADGTYSFGNLPPGTYRVSIDATSAALPDNVAFGVKGTNPQVKTVTAGGNAEANFPFDITRETVKAYGYLGIDAVKPGITPIKGWVMRLYDTEANAALGGTAGRLDSATVKTDANGESVFRFNRSKDVSPNGGASDQIVFAQIAGSPGANYTVNGETVIEIKFNPKDSVVTAPDTFDALYNQLVLGYKAVEVDGDAAKGWNVALRANKDSTSMTTKQAITDTLGNGIYNLDPTVADVAAGGDGVLPDTFWVRLSSGQTANNAHAWSSTVAGDEGTAAGRYARFIWDGTVGAGDTVWVGTETITYKDADIVYRAHHEADDSTGTTPTFTLGDDFTEVGNVTVKILNADGTVARAAAALTAAGTAGSLGAGSDRKFNLPTGMSYTAVAQSTWAKLKVLSDTSVTFMLDGGNQVDTVDVLKGGAGASSFAYKMDNGTIAGTVTARDGTAATGLKVHVMAGPGNIQGTQDTTVVTGAGGAFTTNANLREGPYTVTIADSTTSGGTVWGFSTKLKTTSVPLTSGSADNTDAHNAARDLQGNNAVGTANFLADRMDTKIQGVIANDRDQDENTIDPGEGLAGATVELYTDNDAGTAKVSADSLVGTATTDVNGAFSFSWLREGRYIVKPVPGTPADVVILRGLTNGDTAIVHTAAAAAPAGQGNPDGFRTVGITTGWTTSAGTGIILPRWDYSTSTFNLKSLGYAHSQPHFTFLYQNGQATGTVTKGGTAVANMTITAVKCSVATGYTSPPTIGAGTCTTIPATAMNVSTNSSGVFLFTGLEEGVWQVTANPATAGLGDPVTSALFVLLGNNDVETGNFPF